MKQGGHNGNFIPQSLSEQVCKDVALLETVCEEITKYLRHRQILDGRARFFVLQNSSGNKGSYVLGEFAEDVEDGSDPFQILLVSIQVFQNEIGHHHSGHDCAHLDGQVLCLERQCFREEGDGSLRQAVGVYPELDTLRRRPIPFHVVYLSMTLLHHTLDRNPYTVHCPDNISIENLLVCFRGYLP